MILKIWDNGGRSFDRYTVRIRNVYYGMSENAISPQGFNQFIGSFPEIDEKECGKEISPSDYETLPLEVRIAIKERA